LKIKKTIALLPARGGSKRIPNKNIKDFDGIPLIVHSINYARLHSDIIDDIYVSTDNQEIKDIAIKNGAKVIDRPKNISGDFEPMITTIQHLLTVVDGVETIILLQPTNPLRPKALLKKAYNTFMKSGCDSLITVSKTDKKLGKIIDDKYVPYTYKMGQRSQDIEPLYFENGLLYIILSSLVLENKILGNNNTPLVVDHPYASVDIDIEEDFNFAEYIIKNYPDE